VVTINFFNITIPYILLLYNTDGTLLAIVFQYITDNTLQFWRYSPSCLPNNRVLAEHRLKLLGRRLAKDLDLFQKYSAFINNLLDKDYTRKVPDQPSDKSEKVTWFLTHHPVFHPKKT